MPAWVCVDGVDLCGQRGSLWTAWLSAGWPEGVGAGSQRPPGSAFPPSFMARCFHRVCSRVFGRPRRFRGGVALGSGVPWASLGCSQDLAPCGRRLPFLRSDEGSEAIASTHKSQGRGGGVGRGWEEGPVRRREALAPQRGTQAAAGAVGGLCPRRWALCPLRVGCPGSWLAGQELSRPPGLALG